MTVDVVCAGPPFLDIVFRGLERIPRAGEEVLASGVVIVPGAMANVAFALRQLGLEAVVCSARGIDATGRLLQQLMDEAGVPWIGEQAGTTSVSVALPIEGDRAFVTVQSDTAVDTAAIAALSPRAIVANLPLPGGMPSPSWVYGVIGDPQVAILRDEGPKPLTELRALFLNEREARDLTGLFDTLEAAARLAVRGCLVVVTRGADGAAAATPDGRVIETAAVVADAQDTVGAGDLFTAAFIWADLLDRPLEERLHLAAAYASLSLGRPTSRQKGLTTAAFRDALAETEAPMDWLREA
ncbi:MAG TPA: PfkB family carbohydrate kinase [Candidatus Bathyarchaeia archaeon]|nr:PfkB family carbohydrate kinase [Candidatus Bathyarchaeia archaeon]